MWTGVAGFHPGGWRTPVNRSEGSIGHWSRLELKTGWRPSRNGGNGHRHWWRSRDGFLEPLRRLMVSRPDIHR